MIVTHIQGNERVPIPQSLSSIQSDLSKSKRFYLGRNLNLGGGMGGGGMRRGGGRDCGGHVEQEEVRSEEEAKWRHRVSGICIRVGELLTFLYGEEERRNRVHRLSPSSAAPPPTIKMVKIVDSLRVVFWTHISH